MMQAAMSLFHQTTSEPSRPTYGTVDEEVRLIVQNMRRMESSRTYRRCSTPKGIYTVWRKFLVEWMYYVVDYCKLQPRVVGSAAFFLDVCMERELCRTREEHQLAAATCLQLSLKTIDTSVIRVDKLVKLGRGNFDEKDVGDFEIRLLKSLSWRVHPPTVYCFLSQYEHLMCRHFEYENMGKRDGSGAARIGAVKEITKLLAELCVRDERFSCTVPSLLSYATVVAAMDCVQIQFEFPKLHRSFVHRMSWVTESRRERDEAKRIVGLLKELLKAQNVKLSNILLSLDKTQDFQQLQHLGGKSGTILPQDSPRSPLIDLYATARQI